MKKLIVCFACLIVYFVFFVVYAADGTTAADLNHVSPIAISPESYQTEYVYCAVPGTGAVLDKRDEIGIVPVESCKVEEYTALDQSVPEAFSALTLADDESSFVISLREALAELVTSRAAAERAPVSVISEVRDNDGETRVYQRFVSLSEFENAVFVSYQFIFAIEIGDYPTGATVTVEVINQKVNSIQTQGLTPFLPYLELSFDDEVLQGMVDAIDSNWPAGYRVERNCLLAASESALYLEVNTAITGETIPEAMTRKYYIKLAFCEE